MADELKQSQLARIVVPAITDVKYAEGMADAFDKINDNFKKIASLPFLQGVQGDSYQLEEYPIWEKDTTENWILTEDGKALLNSIFGKDVTTDGNSFNNIRDYIGEELDDVSPLDFFKNGNDIVNNSLYFYVIKDDTGNVIEKQIGQFYYFIDGRIKNIGTVYGDKTSSELLSTFNDYTGFYQYNAENNSYTRLEILPSIYYDQNKNDICWKFNGNETGISAIGVEGRPGKDATLSIVKVTVNSTDVSGVVEAEFKYDATNKFGVWDTNNIKEIKDGKAIICCYYPIYYKIGNNNITIKGNKQTTKDLPSTGNKTGDGWFVQGILFGWDGSNWLMVQQGLNFAYGELIRSNDGTLCAYWNQGSMMSHVINNLKINSYFYDMGESQNASAPHYLAIPSDSNRITGNLSSAHVIRNLRGDLEFLNSYNAFESPEEQNKYPKGATGTPKTVKLTNYNFKVGPANKNVHISSDTVKIGATTYIGSTGAVIDGGLSVKNLTVHPGITNIHGKTNIYDGHLYMNDRRGATSPKGIVIENGDIQLRKGNIGVTGAINASESIVANKNLEAKTGNLTVGNNGHIQGQTLTLGIQGSTSGSSAGRSTTDIINTGDTTKSRFLLNVNSVETGHKRYFTINSSSPIGATGASNYNIARISLGSTASNIKENYIQICTGEDVVYGNNGARAGIQIHSNPDGKNGDVKIKPNLTVEGPGTFNGIITGNTGAIFKGNVTVTNNSTTSTNGNLVIVGASAHSNDSSSDFNTLLNSGNHGQLLIGVPKNQDDGTYRMFLNRASIQTYAYGTTGSTSVYSTGSLYLNPCGGSVLIGSSSKPTSLYTYGQSTFNGEITGNTGATFKGNVKINKNLNVDGSSTFNGIITGNTGSTFKGDVTITNNSTTTTDGNLVIVGAADYSKDSSSVFNTLLNSGNHGQLLIGTAKNSKDGTTRLFLNRTSIQSYSYDGKYSGISLFLNPAGGNVSIGKSGSTTTINGSATINEGANITGNVSISSGSLSVPLNNGIKLTGLGKWTDISGHIDIQEDRNHKQAHATLNFSELMSSTYKKYTSNGHTSSNPAYGKGLVVLYGTGNSGTSEAYSITISNCPSLTLFYFGVKVKNGTGAKDLDNVTVYIQGKDNSSKKAIYTFPAISVNGEKTREFLVFTNSSGGPQFWSHQ